jgi:hypothetical protein
MRRLTARWQSTWGANATTLYAIFTMPTAALASLHFWAKQRPNLSKFE